MKKKRATASQRLQAAAPFPPADYSPAPSIIYGSQHVRVNATTNTTCIPLCTELYSIQRKFNVFNNHECLTSADDLNIT
jgi:hypothetical protein